jgi:hypothetical protein
MRKDRIMTAKFSVSAPAIRTRQEVLPPENPLVGACALFTGIAVLEALDRLSAAPHTQLQAKRIIDECRDALASHCGGGDADKRIKALRQPVQRRQLTPSADYRYLAYAGANHG